MLAAVDKACNYMAGKLASITDPFQMAIVAYALQVSNHEARSVAYELLKAMKREGLSIDTIKTQLIIKLII